MLPSEERFELSLLRQLRHLTNEGKLTWIHETKEHRCYNTITESEEAMTEHTFMTRFESGHLVRLEYEKGNIMLFWSAPGGWKSYSHLTKERYEEGNIVIELVIAQLGLELVTVHRETREHFVEFDRVLRGVS